jgi:hypothetical protein
LLAEYGLLGANGVSSVNGRVVLAQRTVDLVGGDVQEAERCLFCVAQVVPVTTHFFQQVEGADDVGLDEIFRAVNGAVDVTFGGEVDDRARLVLRQQFADQFTIADVTLDKEMATVALAGWTDFPGCLRK